MCGMASSDTTPVSIAIIGAGFSGTALAAALHRYVDHPLHVYLLEKTGQFGAGDAYRTPFPYHLLNARANDMSALEDEPEHFIHWLQHHEYDSLDAEMPIGRQFVPRVFYHQYLRDLLNEVQQKQNVMRLELMPGEVIDIEPVGASANIVIRDQQTLLVDKVVLALGNNPPSKLPFAVSADINCIENPWDYTALNHIPSDDPVLVIGTGLSMVDAVLTLHHQHHRGKITAISRRGLLPLPHSEDCSAMTFDTARLPNDMRSMVKVVRHQAKKIMANGGDWRNLISAMRLQIPEVWQRIDERCRRKFLRHVLPYWNIHRHRVHWKLHELLSDMRKSGQLNVLAGRILSAATGKVSICQRQSQIERQLPV